MKRTRFLASSAGLVLLVLCALSPAARADEFIVNGSFEADAFTGSGLGYRLGLVGTDVTGWFIPASDGVYPWGIQNVNAFGGGPAADGNQWLILGETGASGGTPFDYTIQQTMTGLNPGDTYLLTFAISSELSCCSMVEVSFLSGSSTGAMVFTAPAVSSTFWDTWGLESMNFVATSSDVTLQFKDLAAGFPARDGADLGLDNVSVTSTVPEPATCVLLGSGLLGLALRRLRRKVA